MRATVMYKAGDVRVETVPDPRIVEETDALVCDRSITRTPATGSSPSGMAQRRDQSPAGREALARSRRKTGMIRCQYRVGRSRMFLRFRRSELQWLRDERWGHQPTVRSCDAAAFPHHFRAAGTPIELPAQGVERLDRKLDRTHTQIRDQMGHGGDTEHMSVPNLDRSSVVRVLSDHLPALRQRYGLESLGLFGSAARDELHAESDIDVVVEFDGPATYSRYFDLKDELEDLLGRRVDVVTLRGLKPRARQAVEQELIRVA